MEETASVQQTTTTATSELKRRVPHVFDEVAQTYDALTGMNPGYHRHLRLSAERLAVPARGRILDVCCGTGLSTEALRVVHPSARIVGLDASAGMLRLAREKPLLADVELVHGDAMDPRGAGVTGAFDAILVAYGIRNVPDIDRCLATLRSLLVPGGMICFHEYSVADSLRARAIWDAVCVGIIIPSGLIASGGDARIYRYLRRSVIEFDGVSAFEARLRRAGFDGVHTAPMDGWQRGIVHSFLARRPRR
jgi:ubiquinone/menaquinone biosynthesis C-methylase UbiE